MVLLASSSPDDLFGDAPAVAGKIGASNAVGMDIRAACSGFVFALSSAAQFLHSGAYRTIVVIGSDALSRWVDWTDRNTCVLFGDGAGAVVLKAVQSEAESGFVGFSLMSDSTGKEFLYLPRKCVDTNAKLGLDSYDTISMNGRDVYKFVLNVVPRSVEGALREAKLTLSQVDWLLMHQANTRILDAVAAILKFPKSKVLYSIREYGNTSAASIPLALDNAVKEGRVKEGDIIVLVGFGAGLSWGVSIVKWRV